MRSSLLLLAARGRAAVNGLLVVAGSLIRRLPIFTRPLPSLEYPKVFVVGCPRSGTSWVQQLLQAHPRVVGSEESYAFRRLGNAARAGLNPIGWARLFYGLDRDRIRRSPVGLGHYVTRRELRRLGRSALATTRDRRELHRILVRGLFDGFVRRTEVETPVLVEKTPFHLWYAEEILDWFPEARLVEVVRDGRDVCASMRRLPLDQSWAPKKLDEQIDLWVRNIERGEELRSMPAFQGRIARVRYEDLHDDPASILGALYAACGLEASAALVSSVVEQLQFDDARSAGRGLHLHSGQTGSWQEVFTSEEILIIEKQGLPMARAAGYDWQR